MATSPQPRCPACGSARLRATFGKKLTFFRCRSCRTLIDAEPPTRDETVDLYAGRDYFVKDGSTSQGDADGWGYSEDYLAEQPLIEAKFSRVLGHLERYVDSGRLLDVGCGPGFLVGLAASRGWTATGIDLNEWAVDYGRRRLGLDLVAGDLTDDPFEPGTFDAITMMDVVEHVVDPDDLLARVAKLIRPGGVLALLTPDAGSLPGRALGRRWPEVRRKGEHIVLFSVKGLTTALARHGLVASGWHSIGKIAPMGTLLSDVEPVAPGIIRRLRSTMGDKAADRVVDFDPHTKFCLYARKVADPRRLPSHRPSRLPRRPERLADVEAAIHDELGSLAEATRYRDWLFDVFGSHVPGARVLEVGAGLGTFTRLMLDHHATDVTAVEPEPSCASVLDDMFASDPRVHVVREYLPDAPSVVAASGSFDLVVCQNVLEHIDDDRRALAVMHDALRPGGRLALVVPADPRLFGALDDAYGHWRRYTAEDLGAIVTDAGFDIERLRPINALGALGWWARARRPGARIGAGSLRVFDAMVPALRSLEDRYPPRNGLSVTCVARKAAAS